MKLKPGLHFDIHSTEYHKDPAAEPSLSSSIAKVITQQSPHHAWFAHPRLNPNWKEDDGTSALDFARAAHRFFLSRGAYVQVVDADDYRSADARKVRDAARARGEIPLLRKNEPRANAMFEIAHAAAKRALGAPFMSTSDNEVVGIWKEGDAYCRMMIDKLNDGQSIFLDYKTTSGSADVETATRRFFDNQYHVQAAMYQRGLHAILKRDFQPIFMFQEVDPPYGVTFLRPSEGALQIGHLLVQRAIDMWRLCSTTGKWPSYDPGIAVATVPAWIERKWFDMQTDEAAPAIATDERPLHHRIEL